MALILKTSSVFNSNYYIKFVSMWQCVKLKKNTPTEFEDVYNQSWNSGSKEGCSGVNVFIFREKELNVKSNLSTHHYMLVALLL